MIGIGGVCGSSKGFGRPFIGTVAAFAVAAQTLLIAFGLAIPARADLGTPAFELCLHDAQDAPEVPAGDPGNAAFAAPLHFLLRRIASRGVRDAAGPVPARRRCNRRRASRQPAESPCPRLAAHSIASPRGPPLGA